jgi:hypothetical protein
VAAEHLPSKPKVLSSNTSTTKEEEEEEEENQQHAEGEGVTEWQST